MIWLKEREHVVEYYEVFKKTIDFLQKDRDGYREKLNGLVDQQLNFECSLSIKYFS